MAEVKRPEFKCEKCGKEFTSYANLYKHDISVHEEIVIVKTILSKRNF